MDNEQKSVGMEKGYLIDFEKAIEKRDAPAILRLWEEYTSSDEVDAEDFLAILERVKSSDLHEYIGRHIERALPLWNQVSPPAMADLILKLMVDLQMTNSAELRLLAKNYLESTFKTDPFFTQKIRLVGLQGANDPYKGAVSYFLLLNHLQPGNFVFHTAGWGVGEVIEVSMLREEISLEFDYVPGRKTLSFKNAFSSLIPVGKDHFLARRFGEPDRLESEAKTNPVEVIRLLLRDLGPKTASEIKDELCGLVIPEGDWNRWWQTTRAKIKKDSYIENPTQLKEPFRLLKQEISYEERLQKALENKPDASTLIQMVYSFLKDFSDTLKNPSFKQSLVQKLEEFLSFPELRPSEQLQIYFFLEDLTGTKYTSSILKLIESAPQIEGLLKEIAIQVFKKRVLIETRNAFSNWKEQFLQVLFVAEQPLLRDYIVTELLASEGEKMLRTALLELCRHPHQYPDLLVWYFQKLYGDSSLPFGDREGISRFFEAFLILLSSLEQKGERRELIKKMHNILSLGRFEIVREIMKNSSIEDVQEFLLLITKCYSLSDHDIKIFHSLAEVAHPSLSKKKKKKVEEEDEVIWTTKEGYQLLQKKIEQIGTVETVENAKEIEIARAHGDLRENAEFKAALERRDRLQGELKLLSDQLNKCRILSSDDINTKEVSVGVTVDCMTPEGETISYSLLGPWDADVDKNILSFQSKLAKNMLGLKKGDTFELQGKQLKIKEIRSAIE